MVGKLMKHEIRALMRTIFYFSVISLALAVIARILIAADPKGFLGIFFVMVAIWCLSLCAFVAWIASIQRFSSSFFSGEGYLTFSIPATPMQLLWAKILSALIASFIGVLTAAVSGLILMSGLPHAAWEEIFHILYQLWSAVEALFLSDPLMIVEVVLLFFVTLPASILLFYCIICIGQLFTSHRKGITFGIAVGVIVVVLPILQQYLAVPVLDMALQVSYHLYLWIQIMFYLAANVGMMLFIRYILRNKVNLLA